MFGRLKELSDGNREGERVLWKYVAGGGGGGVLSSSVHHDSIELHTGCSSTFGAPKEATLDDLGLVWTAADGQSSHSAAMARPPFSHSVNHSSSVV